jgi:hypothetical protein
LPQTRDPHHTADEREVPSSERLWLIWYFLISSFCARS